MQSTTKPTLRRVGVWTGVHTRELTDSIRAGSGRPQDFIQQEKESFKDDLHGDVSHLTRQKRLQINQGFVAWT